MLRVPDSSASRRPHLPRSSIVISDEPLSSETNYRTEFVAVLSSQPQGGFVTRKPTPDVVVADQNFWGDNGGFGFFFQRNLPKAEVASTPNLHMVSMVGATLDIALQV